MVGTRLKPGRKMNLLLLSEMMFCLSPALLSETLRPGCDPSAFAQADAVFCDSETQPLAWQQPGRTARPMNPSPSDTLLTPKNGDDLINSIRKGDQA